MQFCIRLVAVSFNHHRNTEGWQYGPTVTKVIDSVEKLGFSEPWTAQFLVSGTVLFHNESKDTDHV